MIHKLLRSTSLGSALLSVTSLLCPLLNTKPAQACGGLFCSATNPVNQAAERIIFTQNDDKTVSAVVEIMYEGPSHEFAWLLPVPAGEITVDVSSKQALDALQQATNPIYNLQVSFKNCSTDGPNGALATTPTGQAGAVARDADGSGVMVVATGSVGPYEYVQIAVDDSLKDPADVAVNWLEDNGYDVTALGPDVLRPYLEENMNLVAFRLSKGNDAGSIRPIFITYQGTQPTIPIRPTAVAAKDDMGVMVWVMGEDRAVPSNYLDLELNEAKINWFNAQSNYNDVVIAAADEAGGQGFVTEYSGPASTFSDNIFPSWKLQQWQDIRGGQFQSIEEFFQSLVNFAQAPVTNPGGFGPARVSSGGVEQYDGFLDALSDPEVVPLREGATAEQFNACVSCYFQQDVAVRTDAYPDTPYVAGEDPIEGMDAQAVLDKIQELVIDPLLNTQALFDEHPTLTRFYTTLSADEMTLDPVFDFNPDLEPVDNQHVAEQVLECNGTDWTIHLPQGMSIKGTGSTWPIEVDDVVPLNFRVTQLGPSGEGSVEADNQTMIFSALSDLGVGNMTLSSDAGTDGNTQTTDETDGKEHSPDAGTDTKNKGIDASKKGNSSCHVGTTGSTRPWNLWALAGLLGLGLLRRRHA